MNPYTILTLTLTQILILTPSCHGFTSHNNNSNNVGSTHRKLIPTSTFRDNQNPNASASSFKSSRGGGGGGENTSEKGTHSSVLGWKQRIPNYLTYLRCVAIPLLGFLFYREPYNPTMTSVTFAVASATDWLDGYLARRWKVTSNFGAFLDPVADKLMVSTALILLSGAYGGIVAIPAAVILAREIGVSALREWMAQRGARDSVKVGFQGKVKTALTMASLTLMLLVPHGNLAIAQQHALYRPSVVLMNLCALITLSSGSVYLRAAWPVLMSDE